MKLYILHLYHQFYPAYNEKCCLPGNIGLNAIQKNKLLPTIVSTTIQPKFAALIKKFQREKLQFCRLVCAIYKINLKCTPKCYDMLGKNSLLDLIAVIVKNINIKFTIIGY